MPTGVKDINNLKIYYNKYICVKFQEEIKAFGNLEKSKKFHGRLYKSCRVLVDEEGKFAADKAVQAEELGNCFY